MNNNDNLPFFLGKLYAAVELLDTRTERLNASLQSCLESFNHEDKLNDKLNNPNHQDLEEKPLNP